MPVKELLVEGHLDNEILTRVLNGRPVVKRGGTKTSLKPRTEEERRRRKETVCYIRDRDFDYEPPADRTRPKVHSLTPDSTERSGSAESALGWYWCRHEMENYLLEPAIVARAIGCDEAEYRVARIAAARRIRDYQAARGAIGITRRSLPPNYKFQTSPTDIPDDSLRLPADLSTETISDWACKEAANFRDRICPQLEPGAMREVINQRRAVLSDELLGKPAEILVWLSGKDILAALKPWLAARNIANPGDFRAHLRDWVREHPEETVSFLPEWGNFITMLNE